MYVSMDFVIYFLLLRWYCLESPKKKSSSTSIKILSLRNILLKYVCAVLDQARLCPTAGDWKQVHDECQILYSVLSCYTLWLRTFMANCDLKIYGTPSHRVRVVRSCAQESHRRSPCFFGFISPLQRLCCRQMQMFFVTCQPSTIFSKFLPKKYFCNRTWRLIRL
jgi:hypothetical protein